MVAYRKESQLCPQSQASFASERYLWKAQSGSQLEPDCQSPGLPD
jgi:hypothetical protein